MKRALQIDPKDNTATVLMAIEAGEKVSLTSKAGEQVGEIVAREAVPFGHKLAVASIEKGGKVLKYGEVIGLATQAISKGENVHIQNVESALVPPPKEVK
jgi:altronate dehydratase small subunit